MSRKKWLPNPRARKEKERRKYRKKYEITEETENLEDTVEMSKEELIALRPDRSRKVSMNTEREKSKKLMQTDTLPSLLMTKRLKTTAMMTVHMVIDRQPYAITTHRPASTPIVSLNTEREKVSTSHAKQTWLVALKNSLPQVETSKTRREAESIYEHRYRFRASGS